LLPFDTASEVALLFLAAGAAWSRLPFYAVLCLPILFAAGMTLLDTLDGLFMTCAYGWAFTSPVRKVYFNITITTLSVVVALAVGTVELLSVIAGELRLRGGVWQFVTTIDLNAMGLLVVGLFVLTWAIALIIWKAAHIEERWTTPASAHGSLSTRSALFAGTSKAGATGLEPATSGVTGRNRMAAPSQSRS
jgi:high-affinity nickel-transport protein